MPYRFGIYILSHSERLMNEVINQLGGIYNNSVYYTDTDSVHNHNKYWSDLVENSFGGKSLGFGKNDYGNSGIFYAWILAPKIKYCLVIDDFDVVLLNARSK